MLIFLVNLIEKFSNSNRSLVIAITKMALVNESLCCYIYSHTLFMLPWASAQCWGGLWKYLADINCLLLHLLGCLRNLQWLSGDMFVYNVRSSHSVLSIMDLFTCLLPRIFCSQFSNYFSSPTALDRPSSTMFNRCCKSGYPCHILGLRGNDFSFSPLSMTLIARFSHMAFIALRSVLSVHNMLRITVMNGF